MIRVLHLTGRPSDFQASRALETLARDAGGDFQITRRAIGPGADYRTLSSAFAGLRHGRDEFDVIHAWDERALTAAALAGGPPVVFTPGPFIRPREIAWLRAVISHRDVQVVCTTTTQRRILVERGIPIGRCHMIRPGVDFARVRR